MKTLVTLLAFALGVLVGTTGVQVAEAPAYLDPPEPPPPVVLSASESASLVNSARAANGLPPFVSNSTLNSMAVGWVGKMARTGLSHNPGLYVPSGFTSVGENVGKGGSVEIIHAAFMNSPGHRANILNPKFTHMGVGVENLNGQVWVVQVFASAAPKPTPKPTPTPKPAPQPTPEATKVPCP